MKALAILLAAVAVLGGVGEVWGQVGVEWSATYTGSTCLRLISTKEGGGLFVGSTQTNPDSGRGWVVNTNQDGEIIWSRHLRAGGFGCELHAAYQTDDSCFILAGGGVFGNSYDYWLTKLDVNGNDVWTDHYAVGRYNECWDMAVTSEGGYVMAGNVVMNAGDDYKIMLIAVDSSGNQSWTKEYSYRGGSSSCTSIAPSPDGGYLIGGTVIRNGRGDFWLLKVSSTGDSLWSKAFGAMGSEGCHSLIVSTDQRILLAGPSVP